MCSNLHDAEVAALFRKMYDLDLVLEPALEAWRSRSGDARVLASLQGLFEFLREAPQDEL